MPSMVERAKVLPPEGQAGAITPDERQRIIQTSMVYGKYDKVIDRESAYEILTDKLAKEQEAKELAAQQKEEEKLRKEEEKRQAAEERKQAAEERKRKAEERERKAEERERKRERDNSTLGSIKKMAVTKAKREAVNAAFKFGRGLLGSLLKGK